MGCSRMVGDGAVPSGGIDLGARLSGALEAAQDLVQKVLAVVVGEWLRGGDDLVQVRVHQLRDQIHVVEAVEGEGPQDVLQSGLARACAAVWRGVWRAALIRMIFSWWK